MTKLKWVNSEPQFQYRIGDAVLYGGNRWSCDARKRVIGSPDKFSQTIAYQYLKKVGQNPDRVDVKILREVVKRYIDLHNIEPPKSDEVVVHLRLGDAKATLISVAVITETLMRCTKFWGIPPSQITLVSAFHIGRSILVQNNRLLHEESHREQTQLANDLQQALCSFFDVPCYIRSSREPDLDFAYLASAKYLMLGSGGFSLAASLASDASVCVPQWCLFNDGKKGNFMPIEDYYDLLLPRKAYTL